MSDTTQDRPEVRQEEAPAQDDRPVYDPSKDFVVTLPCGCVVTYLTCLSFTSCHMQPCAAHVFRGPGSTMEDVRSRATARAECMAEAAKVFAKAKAGADGKGPSVVTAPNDSRIAK